MLLVQECLGGEPDEKQKEVLTLACRGERRISIRSGHGVGKTTVLAWCIICHILTRFPQKTVCTAPTSNQLFDALAAEVKAWITKLNPKLQELLEVKTEEITLKAAPDESFVSFKTSRPEMPEALAGIHSENVLLIGDEASGIPEQVFEAAVGSMSGHRATTILAGNPVRSSGLFFDTHNRLKGTWHTIHISCVGHPRISKDFLEELGERYGVDSNAYRVRVLGEFPLADDDTVIPLELAEAALHRDVKPHLVRDIWGVDCARFGSDSSTLAKRRGNALNQKVKRWKGLDTMQLVGRIVDEWRSTPPSERPEEILVDVIGIGAGVVDRLREIHDIGPFVRGVNVSESPALTERYRNLRAELWWMAREWFSTRDCNLAGDADLRDELVGVRYKFSSNGKIQIESKEDIKKRGRPSPDLADAFILTFAGTAASAIHGDKWKSSWKQPIRRVIRGIV